MKWKSLEEVKVISPNKKKGSIGKAHKYKNYLVIDLFLDSKYRGRYAMDLDTGEYGCKEKGVTTKRKLSSFVDGSTYYFDRWKQKFEWDTKEDENTARKCLGGGDIGYRICDREELWAKKKRIRSLELKYQRINSLMDRIPEEPEHLRNWIMDHNEIIYFFLDEKNKICKCPSCKEEFLRKDLEKVSGNGKAKQNDRVRCPGCKREGILKVRKSHMEQHGKIMILQNIDKEMSVARHFDWMVFSRYGHMECTINEIVRVILYRPHGYKIYYDQCGESYNWYTNLTEPEWNETNIRNRRMRDAYLYPEGITEALTGTDYESLCRAFEAMAKQNVVADYNAVMSVAANEKGIGNTLEYLLKGGYRKLLKDTVGNCDTWGGTYYGILNLRGKTIEETFQIKDRQKINRIRQIDGGEKELEWMKYSDLVCEKISQDTLKWLTEYNIRTKEVDEIRSMIDGKISIEKMRNYLERQSHSCGENIKDTLGHWADYLTMMTAVDQKLDDELFYKPKDLKARHDALVNNRKKLEAVKRMNEDPEQRELEARKMREKFPEAETILKEVKEKYAWKGKEYIMRIPRDLVEIVEEGYALHHCGGSSDRYFNRICNRETYIGFCRKVGEENIPFYTIEFEPDGTIRQNRSYYDEEPDIDSIRGFLKEWQQEIRKRLNRKDLEYAKVSAVLREQNIQELKEKNNQFVLQKLQEDFMAAG